MLLWESVGWTDGLEYQGQDAILAKFRLYYPVLPLGALASPGHVQNELGFHSTPHDWNSDGMETLFRRNFRAIQATEAQAVKPLSHQAWEME